MNRNNIKILTDDEIKFLNSRYAFEVTDDAILVKIQNYNRVTAHPKNETFALNTKVRKIDITPEAIDAWDTHFKKKWSLFEVQNAINILITTYQVPVVEDIEDQLRRGTTKIKVV